MDVAPVEVPDDPLALFAHLRADHDHAFLLQSASGPDRFGRYSIVGFGPDRVVEDPADLGPEALAPVRDDGPAARRLPFSGGLVGFTSWEYVGHATDAPVHDPAPYPVVAYGRFPDGVVYDHAIGRALYFHHGEDRSGDLPGPDAGAADRAQASTAADAAPTDEALTVGPLSATMDRAAFEKVVDAAKEEIRAGEIFQVVLSRAYEGAYDGSLLPFYRRLLETNPSPYMYFLSFDGCEIVGSSPEMLVRVPDGARVETYPIAGTRPLGETPDETRRLAREMETDPKELAEHVMLVDLARNDVGRVARYGTVQVEEFQRIETYSHVQHLVSKVTGGLRPGLSAFDAYDTIFPAGTVSGAPKLRASEIVHALEGAARGPYAGSVGYFSGSGRCDHAICIRTLQAIDGRLSVRAGAGVVADSRPAREFDETEAKMGALTGILAEFGAEAPEDGEGPAPAGGAAGTARAGGEQG